MPIAFFLKQFFLIVRFQLLLNHNQLSLSYDKRGNKKLKEQACHTPEGKSSAGWFTLAFPRKLHLPVGCSPSVSRGLGGTVKLIRRGCPLGESVLGGSGVSCSAFRNAVRLHNALE